MNYKKEKMKKIVILVVLAIVGITSFVWLGDVMTDPNTYKETIEALNEKRDNVIAMTASTTALSAGISLVPGDFGTSIADQLANLSSTLMIVLCAIFLEKYLLVIAGAVTFKVIIPVFCGVYIFNTLFRKEYFKTVVIKLLIFGICIVAIVPVTTYATNLIDETYSVSIEENIEKSDKITDDIEEKNTGFWQKAKNGLKNMQKKVKNAVGNFIEATAILIITSCVFPILTFIFLLFITRNILGINIKSSKKKLTNFAHSGAKVRTKYLSNKNRQYEGN